MERRILLVGLVAALAVLAFGGSAYGYGRSGEVKGPAMTTDEMKAKISAAQTLFTDAKALTEEGVTGKGVDKSQPVANVPSGAAAGNASKPKLKDLTKFERKASFQDADKKFEEASKDVTAVIASLNNGKPNNFPDPHPLKTKIDQVHAAELVADVKFLLQTKLSSLDTCLTLAQGALKIDPSNTDAQQLVRDLANQVAAEKKAKEKPQS
jgi:hypothetical protein